MRNVNSHSFYDNQNSRLSLGITDKGTQYIDFAPIFSAYIGVENPEKGAKVYDNDNILFIPLQPEKALELADCLELLLAGELEVVDVRNEINTRSVSAYGDESGAIIFTGLVATGNEVKELNHILDFPNEITGRYYKVETIIQFLRVSLFAAFKLGLNTLPSSDNKSERNSIPRSTLGNRNTSTPRKTTIGAGRPSIGRPNSISKPNTEKVSLSDVASTLPSMSDAINKHRSSEEEE